MTLALPSFHEHHRYAQSHATHATVLDENGFVVPDMTKSQMQLVGGQVEPRVNTPLEEDLATPRGVRYTHHLVHAIRYL